MINCEITNHEYKNNFISLPKGKNTPMYTSTKVPVRVKILSTSKIYFLSWNGNYSKSDSKVEISKKFMELNNIEEEEYCQIEIIHPLKFTKKIALKTQSQEDYATINTNSGLLERSLLDQINVIQFNTSFFIYVNKFEGFALVMGSEGNEALEGRDEAFRVGEDSELTILPPDQVVGDDEDDDSEASLEENYDEFFVVKSKIAGGCQIFGSIDVKCEIGDFFFSKILKNRNIDEARDGIFKVGGVIYSNERDVATDEFYVETTEDLLKNFNFPKNFYEDIQDNDLFSVETTDQIKIEEEQDYLDYRIIVEIYSQQEIEILKGILEKDFNDFKARGRQWLVIKCREVFLEDIKIRIITKIYDKNNLVQELKEKAYCINIQNTQFDSIWRKIKFKIIPKNPNLKFNENLLKNVYDCITTPKFKFFNKKIQNISDLLDTTKSFEPGQQYIKFVSIKETELSFYLRMIRKENSSLDKKFIFEKIDIKDLIDPVMSDLAAKKSIVEKIEEFNQLILSYEMQSELGQNIILEILNLHLIFKEGDQVDASDYWTFRFIWTKLVK